MKGKSTSRIQFDILDMMRALRGFDRPDGCVVIPMDISRQFEDELERLYAVEDEVTGIIGIVDGGSFIAPQGLDRLRLLTGRMDGAK